MVVAAEDETLPPSCAGLLGLGLHVLVPSFAGADLRAGQSAAALPAQRLQHRGQEVHDVEPCLLPGGGMSKRAQRRGGQLPAYVLSVGKASCPRVLCPCN